MHWPAFAGSNTLADTMFKAADSADINEDYQDASAKYLDLISKIRQSDPGNLKILRAKARLARIYIVEKKFDKAEPLFYGLVNVGRSKLDKEPELMIDLDDLSDAYLKLGTDTHYGYESMKRCLELRLYINPRHPHLPEVYRDLSEYCTRCSNTKDAINWILKAIEIEKQYSLQKQAALVQDESYLAGIYVSANALDKAQTIGLEGLNTVKKCNCGTSHLAQFRVTLGRIYTRKGLFDQADQEFQKVLKAIDTSDKYAETSRTVTIGCMKENEIARRNAKAHHH